MSDPTATRFTDAPALRAKITDLVGAPRSVTRLEGGTKKGVYRIELGDLSTVIAYTWDDAENYWTASEDDVEPFTDASGEQLFLTANATLQEQGIRALEVLGHVKGLVLVEDLTGGTLQQLMVRDPHKADEALAALGAMLERLHAGRSTLIGKLGSPVAGSMSCAQIAHKRAVRHLDEARARGVELSAAVADQLAEAFTQVAPRTEHALVHGELGPDHVFIDRHGMPVLIDIEGIMHFDVEWEHAFMRFRFGSAYAQLASASLDLARTEFYTLCLRLSLIAGPLRLLDGDFPDREAMLAIVDANIAALNSSLR